MTKSNTYIILKLILLLFALVSRSPHLRLITSFSLFCFPEKPQQCVSVQLLLLLLPLVMIQQTKSQHSVGIVNQSQLRLFKLKIGLEGVLVQRILLLRCKGRCEMICKQGSQVAKSVRKRILLRPAGKPHVRSRRR